MAVSSEERTRRVIQEQGRATREHAQQTGARHVPSQEQAERKIRDICERQDKRHEEKRK